MAEYRAVIPAEQRCIRKVSAHAQLVALHLRCLRFSTPTGLGTFELGVLALDCQLDEDDVQAALTELARRTGFSYSVDADGNGAFWIPWQLEHDPPPAIESNHSGWERRLKEQPDSPQKARAVSVWNDYVKKTPPKPGTKGGRTPASAPTTTTTTTPNTTTTTVATPSGSVADAPAKRAPRAKFQIPTPDETRAIFADLGCPQNRMAAIADRCHDYWQSAGWKRKSGPIVDWKATCKTWWGKAVDDDPRLAVRKEPDPPQDYGPEVLFDEEAYWKANPMPKAKGAR